MDDFPTFGLEFGEEIASILALAAGDFGEKVFASATEDEIEGWMGEELIGDRLAVLGIGGVSVKSGGAGGGELAGGDEADGAPFLFGEVEDGGEEFSLGILADGAVRTFGAGGEGGGGGGVVGDSEIAGGIPEESEVGKRFEKQLVVGALVGAIFVEASGGEMTGDEAIADKEDDTERFLDDPGANIEPTNGGEGEEAKESEDLVAELHWERE